MGIPVLKQRLSVDKLIGKWDKNQFDIYQTSTYTLMSTPNEAALSE